RREARRSAVRSPLLPNPSLQFLFERRVDFSNVKSIVFFAGVFILEVFVCARQRSVNKKVVAESAVQQILQRQSSFTRPPQHQQSHCRVEVERRGTRMLFGGFAK